LVGLAVFAAATEAALGERAVKVLHPDTIQDDAI
jgi:hypothetical protein